MRRKPHILPYLLGYPLNSGLKTFTKPSPSISGLALLVKLYKYDKISNI